METRTSAQVQSPPAWRLPLIAFLAMAVTGFVVLKLYPIPETESDRITRGKPPIPATLDTPLCDRVCIISIDGCRPDLLLRAKTPNIHALMDRGCFTFWARTTEVSITLPSHTSMITGVAPWKHGISWNAVKNPVVYPNVPTLMQIAHKYRPSLTSAVIAGKLKFNTFVRDDAVQWHWLPPDEETHIYDSDVAEQAVKIIDDHTPNILFIHFGNVDQVGHASTKTFPVELYGLNYGGWASPDQIDAIEKADTAVGAVLAALQRQKVLASTLVIVTADHGGQGKGHGADDARSRHISWIVAGPHVRAGWDLTRYPNPNIDTEDTFATAAFFLGLPIPAYCDGRPVLDILDTQNVAGTGTATAPATRVTSPE